MMSSTHLAKFMVHICLAIHLVQARAPQLLRWPWSTEGTFLFPLSAGLIYWKSPVTTWWHTRDGKGNGACCTGPSGGSWTFAKHQWRTRASPRRACCHLGGMGGCSYTSTLTTVFKTLYLEKGCAGEQAIPVIHQECRRMKEITH